MLLMVEGTVVGKLISVIFSQSDFSIQNLKEIAKILNKLKNTDH